MVVHLLRLGVNCREFGIIVPGCDLVFVGVLDAVALRHCRQHHLGLRFEHRTARLSKALTLWHSVAVLEAQMTTVLLPQVGMVRIE